MEKNQSNKPIYVTKPFLPDFKDFMEIASSIWDSNILTNNGPLHQELELRLAEYLQVPYVSLFNNATTALSQSISCLHLPKESEVITTPFTFIATANVLIQNHLKPKFCDIEPNSFNIDPLQIETLITPQTKAILGVHCYGLPCKVDDIQSIAKKYDLEVIYDAAHAFGVKCHCGSILNHGRFSILSFHATKVFNTFEGGAVISHTLEDKLLIDKTRNFGFCSEFDADTFGLNAKLSEIHSAMGLSQLEYIDSIINDRKRVSDNYDSRLKSVSRLKVPDFSEPLSHNYSYYPIIISKNSPVSRDDLYDYLKSHNIYARKYFYPLVPDFSIYQNNLTSPLSPKPILPNAILASNSVLCLPMYPFMEEENQDSIITKIIEFLV